MWIEAARFLRARFEDGEIPLVPGSPVYLTEDRALRLLAKAGDQVKLLLDTPTSCPPLCELPIGQHIQWSSPRGTRRGEGALELLETTDGTIWVLVQQCGNLLWVNAAALTIVNAEPFLLRKSGCAQRGNHKEKGGEKHAKKSVQKEGT